MSLLLGLACSPGVSIEGSQPEDTGDTEPVITTDTLDTAEGPTRVGDATDALFGLEQVHLLEITLDAQDRAALEDDPWTHIETDVVFDGELLSSVGLRLKGRYGSYRDLSAKAGFKIDVNRYNEGQTLLGLTHLNINNLVQDISQLHDRVSYNAYRAAGIPAPRVGYVWVTVDGEDYGLYGLVEDYDKPFLDRNFSDPSGNLYDGDYYLSADWSHFVLVDFERESYAWFDLDSGTDVGLVDVLAVVEAIEQSCGTDSFDESMDMVFDIDQFLHYWAMEMWVGQWDGYNYNSNNYRVYFDPERDGRGMMMPWDHDQPFSSGLNLSNPIGQLGACCRRDDGCRDRVYEALDDVCRALNGPELLDDLEATADLINPYVHDDPRREVTYDTALYYQDVTATWVRRRCDDLDSFSGL